MFKKISAACTALAVAATPFVSFAQEASGGSGSGSGTALTMPAEFNAINFNGFLQTIGATLFPCIMTVLGLVAGVWVVSLIWRKVRSIGR